MKERPIIMTPQDAQLCFEGKKTMTRRIIKQRNPYIYVEPNHDEHGAVVRRMGRNADYDTYWPYGIAGDQLWVREAHRFVWPKWCSHGLVYDCDSGYGQPISPHACILEYKALVDGADRPGAWPNEPGAPPWRPSIHMPRWACRTVLEITDVRAERVQEITEADAIAEGCENDMRTETWWQGYYSDFHDRDGNLVHWQAPCCETPPDTMIDPKRMTVTFGNPAKSHFARLWIKIHGAGAWERNDWVWVISFKKIGRTTDDAGGVSRTAITRHP